MARRKHHKKKYPTRDGQLQRFERTGLATIGGVSVWPDSCDNILGPGMDNTGGSWPDFDGVGDTVVTALNTSSVLNAGSSASVEIWVKPGPMGGGWHSPFDGWFKCGIAGNSMDIGVVKYGSGFAFTSHFTTSSGTWYHIVNVFDTTASTAETYINGTSVAVLGGWTQWPANMNYFNVGGLSSGGTIWGPYNGRIDTARVYQRVLTDDEIKHNYYVGIAAHS